MQCIAAGSCLWDKGDESPSTQSWSLIISNPALSSVLKLVVTSSLVAD
jgi:hypothetical protein